MSLLYRVPIMSSVLFPSFVFSGRYMSTLTTVNYEKFFSEVSKKRQPSPIRALMPLLKIPGMISLGGGMPNPKTFPFSSFQFSLSTGETIQLKPNELADALQYSATPGLPALITQLVALQKKEHSPKISNWNCFVTVGSQDGLGKAFEMFLNPGDSILVENPTYPGTLSFLKPFGANIIGIETDGDGIIPEALETILVRESNSSRRPKILYCIPTGQNPSGASLTLERKKKIYDLACKYDLMIIEDDPYYFLSYGNAPAGDIELFKRKNVSSFFSMDIYGRVLRFDSFSKVLGGGLRVGFATGPTALLERLELHQQATLLHNCGLSQALIAKLLAHLGENGWDEHVRKVAYFYCQRRDKMIEAANKHLKGLAKYSIPNASMFLWLELISVNDTHALISSKAVDAKVLFIPGQSCSPNNLPSKFIRASFSTATDEEMDIAMSRLASLLK